MSPGRAGAASGAAPPRRTLTIPVATVAVLTERGVAGAIAASRCDGAQPLHAHLPADARAATRGSAARVEPACRPGRLAGGVAARAVRQAGLSRLALAIDEAGRAVLACGGLTTAVAATALGRALAVGAGMAIVTRPARPAARVVSALLVFTGRPAAHPGEANAFRARTVFGAGEAVLTAQADEVPASRGNDVFAWAGVLASLTGILVLRVCTGLRLGSASPAAPCGAVRGSVGGFSGGEFIPGAAGGDHHKGQDEREGSACCHDRGSLSARSRAANSGSPGELACMRGLDRAREDLSGVRTTG